MHKHPQPAAHIALIDSHSEVIETVEAFFRQHQITMEAFPSEKELFEKLGSGSAFDLILCEIQDDGADFLKQVQESAGSAPVIFLSSLHDSSLALRAIEHGARDFILKPISFPQLLISVHRHLQAQKKESVSQSISQSISQGSAGFPSHDIIGNSEGLLKAVEMAKRVSSSHAHVLICGESGTGKEVIARALHSLGSRKGKAFVTINCSAIPEQLLESELFGHAKGAFTGAAGKKLGLFEEAHGGTLFLDEIGEMSLPLQAKLLRVLQDRQIRRIGENQERSIDARVVAATHRDLRIEVKEKRFREDLFFRLNVIPIYLPPLRERAEDILPLAKYFLEKYSRLESLPMKSFSEKAVSALMANPWIGNVRELENTIERAVILSGSAEVIELEGLDEQNRPISLRPSAIGLQERTLSLEEVTRDYIRKVLEKNGGAKEKTARELGIDRKTLYRKLSTLRSHNREILC